MSIYGAFDISGSGLQAQRVRMDAISANLANQDTPGYRMVQVNFASGDAAGTDPLGVHVSSVDRLDDFVPELVPLGSPKDLAGDGIADGIAQMPAFDYTVAMANGIEALRAYEANIQALETTRSMIDSAIRVLA